MKRVKRTEEEKISRQIKRDANEIRLTAMRIEREAQEDALFAEMLVAMKNSIVAFPALMGWVREKKCGCGTTNKFCVQCN